jgi:hypothetical protein
VYLARPATLGPSLLSDCITTHEWLAARTPPLKPYPLDTHFLHVLAEPRTMHFMTSL